MRQRILSALVGLVILAALLPFMNTPVLNGAISVISALAVHEILLATKYIENKRLAFLCIGFACVVPFIDSRLIAKYLPLLVYLFFMLLFLLLLVRHDTMRIEQIGFSYMMATCIPFALNSVILLRNQMGFGPGFFYLFFIFGSSWIADSGAYFAGVFFGKHKLCPAISPKKTVEGLVGGLVASCLGNLLIAWIFTVLCRQPWFVAYLGGPIRINYLMVALLSPICALAGVFGDLSASIIKRQCGIKDFGHIMPGHGGVLDRFDSVLMVAPMVLVFAKFLPFAVYC